MKSTLILLITAISLGYGQLYDEYGRYADTTNRHYNDLEYKIIDSIYVDPLTNTIYTVDLMIVEGRAHEIDSIIVIYDTKVSVFINNVEHIVPNPGESMFVWINIVQFQCKRPPYDLYDRVYRNSPKVSYFFL